MTKKLLSKKVNLEDAPQALRERVKELLDGQVGVNLLCVEKYKTRPYKDASLVETTFKAFIEWGNLFVVCSVSDCPGASWNLPDRVRESDMIAGDILTLVKNSSVLRSLTGLGVLEQGGHVNV